MRELEDEGKVMALADYASPVPDVWLIRLRGVTGRSAVNASPGSFHDFKIVLTS